MKSLFKKELKSYFDQPTAYILLVIFLVINSFFFFRSLTGLEVASLRSMFSFLPWILLFFVPAITMRTVAEEKKSGTIDILLIQPMKIWEIVAAKALASMVFVTVGLLLTVIIPISLSGFGAFDFGAVFAQYLAVMFLTLALVSLGVFASALTRNQVIAFIVTLTLSFFFIIAGSDVVLLETGGVIRFFLEQFSILGHYSSMLRGVIDLRDIIYFVTFPLTFLGLAYFFIIRERANTKRSSFTELRSAMALLVITTIVLNVVFGSFTLRLDFTKNQLYTLSPATREIMSSIEEPVTIDFFYSKVLPSEISIRKQNIADLLSDIERKGSGKVVVKHRIVEEGGSNEQLARESGVFPVQFNVLKKQEFTLTQGYLGLSVHQGDLNRESIGFVERTDDLEYRLAGFLNSMSGAEKSVVGFLGGHGEKSIYSDYATLASGLERQYELREVSIAGQDGEILEIPEDVTTLVVAGPNEEIAEEEREEIKRFVSEGGSVMFLVDRVNVNLDLLISTVNPNSLADFIEEEYDISVKENIVVDIRSAESVSFGGGGFSYVLPYPFWPKVMPVEGNSVIDDGYVAVLPWSSPVESEDEAMEEIISTSQFGALQEAVTPLSPRNQLSVNNEELGVQTLGVAKMIEQEDEVARVIVIGDSDFITEQFVRGNTSSGNMLLAMNAIDWLTQDLSLTSIRSKVRQPEPLLFEKEGQFGFVRMINLVVVPLLLAGFGVWNYMRRQRKMKKKY